MSNENKTTSSTTPWLWMATFVLAILKLTGAIEITWLWVFSPVLIPLGIAVIILLVAFIIFLVDKIIN